MSYFFLKSVFLFCYNRNTQNNGLGDLPKNVKTRYLAGGIMVALIPDISKRMQAGMEETVVRQSKASKQSFNGKTILDLAGGIAHDFKNLLYPIVGYTEMTMKDMPEDSPARSNLEEVLKAASRAHDLIQQFLNFNCHGEISPKPLQVQIIIKEVLKFLRASQPKTIEICEDIGKDCGLVLADPTQVHRIIMNLCTNACHAMQQTGGKLKVALAEIDFGPETSIIMDFDPGTYLRLTVSDTGQGIDSSDINRIFDPFFTTKKENQGAGLGLFVALGIVRGYGGNISVSSALSKGTDVDVYLPQIDTGEKHWRQIERINMDEGKITMKELQEYQEDRY